MLQFLLLNITSTHIKKFQVRYLLFQRYDI